MRNIFEVKPVSFRVQIYRLSTAIDTSRVIHSIIFQAI